MQIESIGGQNAALLGDGLKSSGGRAVFVRYHRDSGCAPWAPDHGAFDSAGVSGLYLARPREIAHWVDGMPTFDVVNADEYPLPQRLGDLQRTVIERNRRPLAMNARELFDLYRALWASSIAPNDPTVETRARRYLATHAEAARKFPAAHISETILSEAVWAKLAEVDIRFAGIYETTIVVPGVDSTSLFVQVPRRLRGWDSDVARDPESGIALQVTMRSFALDVLTSAKSNGFGPTSPELDPCPPILITISELPSGRSSNSLWAGTMRPQSLLECTSQRIALAKRMPLRDQQSLVADESTPIVFRQHADGRVTFDAMTLRNDRVMLRVRGVRSSSEPGNR